MNVLFLADVFSGCTWYRCVLPGHELEKVGHGARIRVGSFSKADLEWADVLAGQRLWDDASLAAVRWMNAHGKTTVYDLDDDLWSIGPENSSSEFWAENGHKAVAVLRECHHATTTGEALAEVMRAFHPDVRVVPNAIAPDWQRAEQPHDGLVIGWAGSATHAADIRMVADTLYDILDTRDVRMEIAGGDWLTHPKVTRIDPVPIERYHTLVSRFDIGIAPITDNRFNRCKSDLKYIEYAGLGIPSVCSKVGPYAESVRHGDTGYLATTAKDWRRYLLRLIDDAEERQAMGERALRYADTRRVDTTRWLEALTA